MAKQAIKNELVRSKILNMARKKDRQQYTLLIIGIYSGFRISDILALTVGDVIGQDNFNVLEIKTLKTKAKKTYRKVLIHDCIKKAVKVFAEERELGLDDFIFYSSKNGNKAINSSTARRWLNFYGDKFGLDLSTHSLRKTFGFMNYTASNGNLSLIQSMLNHESQADTLKYIGIEQDDIDDMIRKMQ